METNLQKFALVVVIVMVISFGLIFWASKTKAPNVTADGVQTMSSASNSSESSISSNPDWPADRVEKLAKFMTEKGMKMYGAYWCSHCNNQKRLFGDNSQYITFVECDPKGENQQAELCKSEGIEGYPTWKYEGKAYEGEQDFDELAQIVGFVEEGD